MKKKTAENENPFAFVGGGKRYYTQNCMLREKFGCKVIRIPLSAGFTCPNIDGTKGTGGCIYCSAGSRASSCDPQRSITEQYYEGRAAVKDKWGEGKYIPYFQSNTNTYGSLGKIRSVIDEAMMLPDVCGIAVSTRPDCISEEIADYFADLSEKTYLTVELGLQTVFDETAARINRCHTYEDFLKGYELLASRNVNICVHLIDGLPGETHDMMMRSAREMAKLKLHGIKLHLLHILKNTAAAAMYAAGEISVMTLEEYVTIICDQLEVLPPELCIWRVTGDGERDSLIAPLWSLKKFVVMDEIDKEMRRRGSWQGKYYTKEGGGYG